MMIIRELPSQYKFYLAYAEEQGQLPILYGYAEQEDRDEAYDNFLITGEVAIFDILSGTFKTIYPILMGKVDLTEGTWLFTDSTSPLH